MTRKLSALTRVSSLAIAASLTASAAAQSLLGTPTVTFGSANISESTGTTDVDVFSSSAVIDWTPDDNAVGNFGAIAFQNSGTTATFRGFEGDYAVLNRINVADNSRKIFMNGTIQSFINTNVGGDIFFYSPSGFVVGANAVINVGSLVLSASPISVDGNGGFINGGIVTFAQADPGASITTVAGSQINALTAGSYVALVAPRVEHNGSIAVNGAAALVGAEAATINFRTDSLFDITVNMGTTDANGVVVGSTGSITGPASTGAGDLHRAYLVAVPKNTAMTMLISSGADLGFEVAGAADVVGNAVILSAGHDVAFGESVGSPSFASGADADISIENASFTSRLDGRANGDIVASSVAGSLSFASDVRLIGRDLVKLEAGGDGNVSVGGNLRLDASASGENEGESAQAGNVTLQAFAGGQLSVTGDTVLTATGTGAFSSTSGIASGDGRGGTILVQATTGGDMFLGNVDSAGSLDADASGFGGSFFGDIDGGDGIGGTVNVFASGDGTLTVAGATYLRAEGWAGQPSDCFQCGGIGGTGDAGNINVQAHSGAASKIDLRDVLFVFADGHGGDGQVGGAGLGGNVVLSATGGGIVDVASDVSFAASGLGGNARGGTGNGGNGVGGGTGAGFVVAFADGGTLTIGGDFAALVDGTGGDSEGGTGGTGTGGDGLLGVGTTGTVLVSGLAAISASGTGGDGVTGGSGIGGSQSNGGRAFFYSDGGSLTVTGLAAASANGQGGAGSGGAGGNATGGSAGATVNGGTAHFLANLIVDSGATGGDGDTGGNATALTSPPENELGPIAISLFAQNGGQVTVDGITVLAAEAVGGNGSNGNGGNAQGGEIDVATYVGDLDLNSLSIDANAYGGDGGNGGSGGNATGGNVDLTFGFQDASIGGTIMLGSAFITADGEGGEGGAGTSGPSGGNGGAGGTGSGGRIIFTGSAAGGTLDSGVAFLTALGTGGAGGAGGSGSAGAGGNGGAGGTGNGGSIQTGTISSEMAITSGGGANYTTLSADSSATGGDGGAGGVGSSTNGAGGNGGNGQGGSATFLARGVLVTADTVTLGANATGGDGGAGSSQGNGGNARTGTIQVESKDRFGHADQRGTLQADSITGSAVAMGGTGATNGVSSVIGNSYFRVLNGDADIGSFSFNTAGDIYDNTFVNSTVSVRDGTATIGDFSFTTTGELALDASNGSMTANTINLAAKSFIADSFSGAQAGPGTYSAGSFSINTGGNFLTNAHLVSGGSLSIVAPGAIDMRNATSSDGNLTLQAGSSILAGILGAAGFVSVLAPGNITLGSATAGDSIDVESSGGAILTGNLTAATTVDLDAAGNIGFGNVVADAFDFSAGGDVDGGDILAATQASGEAEGAIDLGNISVGIQMAGGAAEDGFAVGFSSATSINVLDVEADESIGFATLGNLTTGDLDAGQNVMALVGGNMNLGSITTAPAGRTYLADVSMFLGNGGPNNFDPAAVLLSPPVTTGGSITIGGPVSTGRFQAAAGTSFTAGQITAQQIEASARGLATINGIWSAQFVNLISGDIDIGASGGIEGDSESSIVLQSTNGDGALIGDGLSGSGYRLSNAEFGRISAGELAIVVGGAPGAAADTLIGDLDITGPFAGSTIESSTGGVTFMTLDEAGEGLDGTLRIVGEVNATGFGTDNYLSFQTQQFELDAATGLLNIENAQGGLGGQLWITAQDIHVAEGAILDQLAEDSQYEGYQDDLNAPASVERPDGVIRAASMDIEFISPGAGELNTLYVQNTGTEDVPAGFLVGDAQLGDDGEGQGAPQSIDLIINGQIVSPDGTLTGVDVRDALVANRDLTPFTANSTVNGCLLTGACEGPGPGSPFPPDFTPTPGIQDEIILIGDDPMPPPEFGNEDVIDDNDEETEDSSPIVPPQPLFDTSELGEAEGTGNPAFNTPMRSNPGLTEKGDVDDPVSGSGNPALMEAGDPPVGNEEKQP